ncbi:hypothetical protein PsYK624_146830 [Phanerochaete sordida]|uniref:Uncharacterized protein n=1 Tax=Phanerochaete sordida TaxID=48140 RepID=A0A9P3GNW2_9APHY|nr:hypothetical protein PsYK624_146830 [Phanerochaete sordida]
MHYVIASALTWRAREQYNRRRDASSCSTATSPSIAHARSLSSSEVCRKAYDRAVCSRRTSCARHEEQPTVKLAAPLPVLLSALSTACQHPRDASQPSRLAATCITGTPCRPFGSRGRGPRRFANQLMNRDSTQPFHRPQRAKPELIMPASYAHEPTPVQHASSRASDCHRLRAGHFHVTGPRDFERARTASCGAVANPRYSFMPRCNDNSGHSRGSNIPCIPVLASGSAAQHHHRDLEARTPAYHLHSWPQHHRKAKLVPDDRGHLD